MSGEFSTEVREQVYERALGRAKSAVSIQEPSITTAGPDGPVVPASPIRAPRRIVCCCATQLERPAVTNWSSHAVRWRC